MSGLFNLISELLFVGVYKNSKRHVYNEHLYINMNTLLIHTY